MLKQALDKCKLGYESIVNVYVHTAITHMREKSRTSDVAVIDVRYEASGCEEGFFKGQSPLTGLTQRMEKICDVTRAIIYLCR